MIYVLCEVGTEATGNAVKSALEQAYRLGAPPTVLPAGAVWGNARVQWDDLLVVVYKSQVLDPAGLDFVNAFRMSHWLSDPSAPGQRRPGGFVIPVATDPAHVRPPAPIDGIKAALFDGSDQATKRIVDSAGVFLGMALRPGENQVFVSYRATDGKAVAEDLYRRLREAGLNPWLDEAKEGDVANLYPGQDVQQVIIDHLKLASMILVVDTVEATASKWIDLEVETAIGELIPIFPVVVGPDRLTRFFRLGQLRRQAAVKPGGAEGTGLSNGEWELVCHEVEELLLQTYRRRQKSQDAAERAFVGAGYDWKPLDLPKRVFRSFKKLPGMPATVVWSHCFVQDIVDLPALEAYKDYIAGRADVADAQHKLCIYDRERVLSDVEMDRLEKTLKGLPFIPVHFSELTFLIQLNFAGRQL